MRVGERLRNIPIRQKLILMILATTAVALLWAGIGIVFADLVLFRSSLKIDLSTLAHIVADNTTAALTFNDPTVANETLAALRARTHIIDACLYQTDNRLFARYARKGTHMSCPKPGVNGEIRFEERDLIVSRPIVLEGRRIGTLVLAYDLGEMYERVQLYGLVVLVVMLISWVLALLVSSKLRTLIAGPVIDLSRTATLVSHSRDYGTRATKFSADELGVLVDAFNEMLAGIQSRDSDLRTALVAREDALAEAHKARASLESTLESVAQLNAELRTSNESLARSNEDLERFAFIASHDLQEPLRMIAIYSQLLVRRFADSAEQQVASYVENIENGTKRMRELLADLLAYAEIGARFEDQPAEAVDLNEVVKKVLENLTLSINESGASIKAAPLPVISGLESHFIPLFQNLIGNAIKYRSEQRPEIYVTSVRKIGFIQLCIADNGMGIAPEYHSKIFVAFKRLHGKKIPGTGIGLAICQRVVERYGGRIWVESDVGQGSNFIFTLPASLLTIGVQTRDN